MSCLRVGGRGVCRGCHKRIVCRAVGGPRSGGCEGGLGRARVAGRVAAFAGDLPVASGIPVPLTPTIESASLAAMSEAEKAAMTDRLGRLHLRGSPLAHLSA